VVWRRKLDEGGVEAFGIREQEHPRMKKERAHRSRHGEWRAGADLALGRKEAALSENDQM